MTLDKLMSELRFKSCIEQAVRQEICRDRDLLPKIAETAYDGGDFDYALCRHEPLTRLTVVTYLLLSKYDDYKSKEIPDDIIFETFRDVSLRANLYYAKTGKPGISKNDVIWFRHMMHTDIFKVGALQFQPFEMLYLDEEGIGEPYMVFAKEQKEALPGGTPVLNCHIQYGADLSRRSVSESLKSAKTFFREYFPTVKYRAFLCYSWLLYPPMLRHLSEASNIRQFAEQFIIIGSCSDPEQAIENLLGNDCVLNEATSLQKMAAEHRKRFGFACGIIPI